MSEFQFSFPVGFSFPYIAFSSAIASHFYSCHLNKTMKTIKNNFSLPMGSVATAGLDSRLGLLRPLALMAVILCSYSRPSIRSVDRYLVMVTGFLLARTHLSDLTSFRSIMYPETSRPPSSSGGFQATVIPSRETSKTVGRPGGPGTSVETRNHQVHCILNILRNIGNNS